MSKKPTNTERLLAAFNVRRADVTQADRDDYKRGARNDYERGLLSHMQHYNVKQWLLDGAKREGTRTIMDAVQKIPEHRLVRRLARILAADRDED
jgi:hypothetical protein